jgi:hypothetical protein
MMSWTSGILGNKLILIMTEGMRECTKVTMERANAPWVKL